MQRTHYTNDIHSKQTTPSCLTTHSITYLYHIFMLLKWITSYHSAPHCPCNIHHWPPYPNEKHPPASTSPYKSSATCPSPFEFCFDCWVSRDNEKFPKHPWNFTFLKSFCDAFWLSKKSFFKIHDFKNMW